ncbi:MAG TPA: RNA polymerase sigma factor [Polyangiaceae bacterium]
MSAPRVAGRAVSRASDAELLEGVASGDLGALGELYDRYARHVWQAARRSLDGVDAEDVVHQLFVKLPAIAPSYDGRASCRGWLCGIAVRLAMRHRRGAGRFRRMLGSFAHTLVGSTTRDPERAAMGNQELGALERALAALSEKKRVVFVLVEVEGLTAEEAARVLDIPAATARTRLFHARKELQAALEAEGVK